MQKQEEATGVIVDWHDRKAKKKTVTAGKAEGARKLLRAYASEANARAAVKAEACRAARQPRILSLPLGCQSEAQDANHLLGLQGCD